MGVAPGVLALCKARDCPMMLRFAICGLAPAAAAEAFQILPGPVSTLNTASCLKELLAGLEVFMSAAPPGTFHRLDVELPQDWTSEDVTSIQVPHTPIDGTTGQVQLPVGQEIGRSETLDESMPAYSVATVSRAGAGLTKSILGAQPS